MNNRKSFMKKRQSTKLEVSNKKHDDHGIHASVPGKHSDTPKQHWEMNYSLCKPSRNMELTKGSDFSAKISSDRKTTYKKVNKEDH